MSRLTEARALRVLSYNLHRFVGVDGRADPERAVQVIRAIDADVVAVQELGWAQPGDSQSPSAFSWLEQQLGMTGIAATGFSDARGAYGQALFSRLPLLEQKEIDISVAGREPRKAIQVSLQWQRLHLQVIAVHLGLSSAERQYQMDLVWKALDSHPCDAQLLLGDFNEWNPWSGVLRRLRAGFGTLPRLATFPARWPRLALDRIWIRGECELLRLDVGRNALARVASDHLPLWAELSAND